ncbi:hypothetical protein [Vibrio sp. SCSIO 43136]|uniref:hypothetical protein n=1 Tax=Vibrio sp. SCSIO 43136 TaxID=2819101 RepID=UPI00207609EF|nr:hypothetical protein [Vibrio sp. SCSIO 43136]USD65854.1 hypothetical protein J4N39_03260 [Vibrio sp. SCSIO 43136]
MNDILIKLNNEDWMPYTLPTNVTDKARVLGEILSIPRDYITHANESDLQLMLATLLYPHLDRFGRKEVLAMYLNHQNQRLAMYLRGEAVLVTKVNKSWGMWSLSTQELNEKIKGHKIFEKVLALLGASSFAEIINKQKGFKTPKVQQVLLAIVFTGNAVMLSDSKTELKRRTKTNVKDYSF